MDCDFFESLYYYPQLNPQGEIVSGDDLSWLTYPTVVNQDFIIDHDPTEQVGNPTAVATKDIVHPPPQTTPALSEASGEQSEQEVTPEPLIDITNDVLSVESPRRYELPPRSTRGFPPKRYDPEFEAQRSRYPINYSNVDNLSQSAVAFTVALYSSTIPRDTEEALQNLKWKRAMEGEIASLKKINTLEKCMVPKRKKTVGYKWVSRSNIMSMEPLRDTKPDL